MPTGLQPPYAGVTSGRLIHKSREKAGIRARMPALSRIRQLFGEPKHGQDAAELGVVGQSLVGADCAETVGILGQTRRHTDAGPTAYTRQHGDILLATMGIGVDIADDP